MSALFCNSFLKNIYFKISTPRFLSLLLSKKYHCNCTTRKSQPQLTTRQASGSHVKAHHELWTPLVPIQASLQKVVDNVASHAVTIFRTETTQMELLLWRTTLESYLESPAQMTEIVAWCQRPGLRFRRPSLCEVVIPEVMEGCGSSLVEAVKGTELYPDLRLDDVHCILGPKPLQGFRPLQCAFFLFSPFNFMGRTVYIYCTYFIALCVLWTCSVSYTVINWSSFHLKGYLGLW